MHLNLTQDVKETAFYKSLVEDHELILDNSTFIQMDSCSAQGIMGGVLKKQPTANSIHLDFGGALHEAIEAKYKHGASIKEQIQIAEDTDSFKKMDRSHPVKTPAGLRDLLLAYHVHSETVPQFDILYLDGEPCVELSFRLHLGTIEVPLNTDQLKDLFRQEDQTESVSIDVYWEGKTDALGVYQGEPWLIDHKTTSIMGPKFADTFLRSSQMLGYLWAGGELIKKGMSKLHTADGTEYDLEKRPYRGVLINAMCTRKSGPEFKCFPIPLPNIRVTEWKEETLLRMGYLVNQIADYMSSGTLIPTREHCVTKYGRCAFFDVCEAPQRMRGHLLNSPAFKTSNWSPLD